MSESTDARTSVKSLPETSVARTLVKSPPELWEACSDPATLARHLGDFGDVGELTITQLEPERSVAWEGERISGTVELEPSGWGTRVRLTAEPRATEPVTAEIAALRIGDTDADAPSGARGFRLRRGLLDWLRDRLSGRAPEAPASALVTLSEPADGQRQARAALEAALDSLGQAHHRPFSRS